MTTDDMRMAADWLRVYHDANSNDAARLLKVAEYLDHEVEKRDFESTIKKVAREQNIRPSAIRARLKEYNAFK